MNRISFLMGIALLALSPFLVNGQLLDPVSWQITASPDTVRAGEIFSVEVKAEIDGDWHLYSVQNDPAAGPFPTTFSAGSSGKAIAGTVTETEAKIVLDPNFNAELGWHSNSAYFTIPVAFRSEIQGDQSIDLDVLYQVCDDKSCLPPKTKSISAGIYLAGIADTPFTGFDIETDDSEAYNFPVIFRFAIYTCLVALFILLGYRYFRLRKN